VTKLQKQIPIPQENEHYDPSGQIVAQVPPGEWPSSQSDLRGYNEFEFMELCNVTEIQPDEIITAYPFGKAINMTLYGTSTISSGGGISFFTGGNGSYTCSSPAGNVKFLLVQ
jgi:hypothetical protein